MSPERRHECGCLPLCVCLRSDHQQFFGWSFFSGFLSCISVIVTLYCTLIQPIDAHQPQSASHNFSCQENKILEHWLTQLWWRIYSFLNAETTQRNEIQINEINWWKTVVWFRWRPESHSHEKFIDCCKITDSAVFIILGSGFLPGDCNEARTASSSDYPSWNVPKGWNWTASFLNIEWSKSVH